MKSVFYSIASATLAVTLTVGCRHCPAKAPTTSTEKPAATQSTSTASAQTPTPSPQNAPIRINAGVGAFTDATGVAWLEDSGFSGGDVIDRPDLQIANTKQPEIYRSEHYSMESFAKKVPNGRYEVKLHFCETYDGIAGPGDRVFTFEVEGRVFKDFDVWAKAGGSLRAYVETIPVEISDGQLDIKFTPQVENPQINAIEILPKP